MAITLLLHGRHGGPAVRYEPLGDWLVPWRFGAFEEEYRALRAGVALLDCSTQALVECRGADRVSFLHRLLTNDLKRLSPGGGARAALLTPSGKLLAELLVLADAEAVWLLCDLPRAAVVAQTLEHYLFSDQVTVTNHERRKAALALEGPRAAELLAALVGPAASLAAPGDHATVSFEGLPVWLIRHSLIGGSGVLCLVDADQAEAAWGLLQRRGRPQGVRPVGWEALNTARIEAGVPWFGLDMDETTLLPETGLQAVAVSETKGCYVGQEVIARMQTYGSASKKLMGLLVEGQAAAGSGDRIVRGASEVGWVTSGCHSPVLRRPIAMGYVKRGAYEPGTAVEIVRAGGRVAATVAERPLVTLPASSARTPAGA
ncbi:MAG: aminomethyl transferase family protein [Candidatus Omnitrophica bacterium]|nr:aminomethyl transferase family protein [Candidatus Omnitrophota bacterium]